MANLRDLAESETCTVWSPHLQTLTMRPCSGISGSMRSQTARVPAKLVASVVAASSAPKVFPLKAMPASEPLITGLTGQFKQEYVCTDARDSIRLNEQ